MRTLTRSTWDACLGEKFGRAATFTEHHLVCPACVNNLSPTHVLHTRDLLTCNLRSGPTLNEQELVTTHDTHVDIQCGSLQHEHSIADCMFRSAASSKSTHKARGVVGACKLSTAFIVTSLDAFMLDTSLFRLLLDLG